MELREYFKIIGRRWIIFVLTFVVIILGTYIYLKTLPETFLGSTTLTVNKVTPVKQSQVNYYLFDNYYNAEAMKLFSSVVASWFSSPTVVTEIYEKAGLSVPSGSQADLAKTFKALRQEPATINVTVVANQRDEAQKLIDTAATVMQEKADEVAQSNSESAYDIVKFNTLVTDNLPNTKLDLIIAAIVGLMFGAVLAFSIEYFKK